MSAPDTKLVFKLGGKIIDIVYNPAIVPAISTKVRCGAKKEGEDTQQEYFIVDMSTKFPEPNDDERLTTITFELTE